MTAEDSRSLPVAPPPRPGMIWLFSGVWLLYLVYPIGTAIALDDVVAKVFGLVLIAAFAIVYMASFYRLRTSPDSITLWPQAPQREVWIALGTLVGLMAAATVPLGGDALAFSVYISALAAFTLPTRQALPCVAAMAGVVLLLPLSISGWEHQEGLAFQVGVSGFAAWGVSQIIVRNRGLAAAREQLAVLAVAEERLRVGRDVHDILGHSLTVITIKTELAQRLIDVDVVRAKAELADIEKLAREALAGVRDTVGGLREVSLDGELANARTALSAAGIVPELPSILPPMDRSRAELFGWIVREAVTNVVRHSDARRCEITVASDSIDVSDDGRGVGNGGVGNSTEGTGLVGLRERVAAAGGSLRLGSDRGGRGFHLAVSFPPTIEMGTE
ncbi:sensor histidine kinase [Antrihabitans sp. YC3-6]|uniref:Sensor histidine kinase n=1 Tax=Antrihabitans stalagmiti TaxID=2799499 RepID=A0A934NV32_9NOCA|nr:histidine kinase [Antrihabitans stalagmiti]MBJ8342086.1 sensor histidine kinase [Antrihabitans stalagmiti]